jgi:hypothetical protein
MEVLQDETLIVVQFSELLVAGGHIEVTQDRRLPRAAVSTGLAQALDPLLHRRGPFRMTLHVSAAAVLLAEVQPA